MALEQVLIRGDSDTHTVYTPWMPSRGSNARCFMKMIAGVVNGLRFKWTVETKNTEDLDSAAITIVDVKYATTSPALPDVKEAVTTSEVKELFRYTFSWDTDADETDYIWYQCMEPIWEPT